MLEIRGKKVVIVHHNDGDGICSAAIFAVALKRNGKFPAAIVSPEHVEFDDSIFSAISKHNPDFLVVLDLPLQLIPELNKPSLIIDHHPSNKNNNPNSEIIHDTSRCAAYLTFMHCQKMAKIDDIAWIAAVGCMSDKDVKGFNEIMKIVEKESSELSLQEIQRMVSFVSSGKLLGQQGIHCGINALIEAANMEIPTAVLGSTPNAQKLRFLRKVSRRERDYWLLFHKDFAKMDEKLVYYKINTQLPVHSYLAGTLSNIYPNHLCLVANKSIDGKKIKIEGRTKIKSFDIGTCFFEIGEQLGGNGGGLNSAGGIKISPEKEEEFIEEIKIRLGF